MIFKTVEDAISVFSGLAEETLITALVSMLLPVTMLEPSPQTSDTTLSFMGGAPVWAVGIDWPVPPLPDDIEELAQRGGPTHAPHIRTSLEARVPYAFLGQVDLADIDAPDLPLSGRLHFFYDIATGPWDTGTRPARVIWDNSPADATVAAAVPKKLLQAEERARAEIMAPLEIDESTRKILRETGMTDAEIDALVAEDAAEPIDPGNFYLGPKQAVTAQQVLHMPSPFNLEWDAMLAALTSRSVPQTNADTIRNIFEEAEERLWERKRESSAFAGAFQLGGLPVPEQDDPRYDAATVLVLGKQFPDRAEWEENKPALTLTAQDLRLLLQVSVSDWLDSTAEGTVYFLISTDDLKARRFENVIAVYQQT